jgi:hypothetical protein
MLLHYPSAQMHDLDLLGMFLERAAGAGKKLQNNINLVLFEVLSSVISKASSQIMHS